MSSSLYQASLPNWLNATLLQGIKRGIEKESLRLDQQGYLSQMTHPIKLGKALTHPNITTDYSEALLEFITPPLDSPQEALQYLTHIHQFTLKHLPEEESLWSLSMPCLLNSDENFIPLAQYGDSNLGQFKTLYRHGLGIRYGRKMQTIAGIHYNISFPERLFEQWYQQSKTSNQFSSLTEFKNTQYLGLIRNFKRLTPFVVYLLGASPVVCSCFLTGRQHHLQNLNDDNLYLPFATALRMGKLGYQNSIQDKLNIQYNDLNQYLKGLSHALKTPQTVFLSKGLDNEQGQPIQINGNILQIENEFYAPIRPKQPQQAGESPSEALKKRGIGYVELRTVDLNPFSPIGIDLDTACFLEVLALYCLLSESPDLDAPEEQLIGEQLTEIVDNGRAEALQLPTNHQPIDFKQTLVSLLNAMHPFAEQLDLMAKNTCYQKALQHMLQRANDVTQTLSHQVLSGVQTAGCHAKYGLQLSQSYKQQLLALTLPESVENDFLQKVQQSITEQHEIETADQLSFKEYLKPYRSYI